MSRLKPFPLIHHTTRPLAESLGVWTSRPAVLPGLLEVLS